MTKNKWLKKLNKELKKIALRKGYYTCTGSGILSQQEYMDKLKAIYSKEVV